MSEEEITLKLTDDEAGLIVRIFDELSVWKEAELCSEAERGIIKVIRNKYWEALNKTKGE